MDVVLYDIPAWGVGELYFRTGKLLFHELPRAGSPPDEPGDHPLAERIRAYFRGERSSFDDVEIEAEWATPFQAAIADALRGVPWGEVVTYGELAALAGHPNAYRAVGTFCARNRFSLVLPCHRVIGADGIGLYGSLGVGYKRRLLALERVAF